VVRRAEREGLQVFIRQLFFAPVARRACSLRRSGAGPIARGGRAGPERHTFETAQSNLMPSASTSTTFGPVVWPLIPSRRDQTRKGSRPADEPCHSGDAGRRAEQLLLLRRMSSQAGDDQPAQPSTAAGSRRLVRPARWRKRGGGAEHESLRPKGRRSLGRSCRP
jgi:hypothetical protein